MIPEWLQTIKQRRKLFYQKGLDSTIMAKDYDHQMAVPDVVETEDEANLISSWLGDDVHAPALDLDIAHEYVPSSTNGHGHLFLDVELSSEQYKKLLDVLLECGIIEKGFYKQFESCGATFLRTRKKGEQPPAMKIPHSSVHKHLEQYYQELSTATDKLVTAWNHTVATVLEPTDFSPIIQESPEPEGPPEELSMVVLDDMPLEEFPTVKAWDDPTPIGPSEDEPMTWSELYLKWKIG